ncbi:MAG: hypothetical protein AAB554_04990 [Patescibacteria group bacterium]
MKRAHVIAILLVLAVSAAIAIAIGYRPVSSLLGLAYADAPSGEAIRCDYEGRTYALREQRRAEDGCNVCACGENGWSCTKIACMAGGAGSGTIAGTLSYPSESLPAQRVCAVSLKDDKEYCQQTKQGETSYAISAPAGDFWVYAARSADESGKRAYFSESVICGLKAECTDHTPVTVALEAGKIARADPQDWYAAGQIDLISVTPSRYEYDTHNYYPKSALQLRARGLAKVEFFATPYPPSAGTEYASLGEAAFSKEERGIQVWSLPVPSGFQAMDLRAKGTSENGEFLMSRVLRIIRPIETASASGTAR